MKFRFRATLSVAIVTLLTVLSWQYFLDDALIYYRYVRNALQGIGFVFNRGERFDALTSPLFSYLLLLTGWATGRHIHLAATLIFLVTFAAGCVIAENLVPYSGIFLASMSYFYSLVGMETSLLILLLLAAMSLYQADLWEYLPSVLALLLATRIEAGAFVLAFMYLMYRRNKWPPMWAYIPAAGILAIILSANYMAFHALIAASSSAKLAQGHSGFWGRWPTAFLRIGSLQLYSRGAPYTMPAIGILGVLGILKTRPVWGGFYLISAGIMLCFYVLLNIPNYHWYYSPFVVGLVLYGVAWLNQLKTHRILVLSLTACQLVAAAWFLRRPEPRIADYRQLAHWLNKNADLTASVEACEIGELGWATQLRVIDKTYTSKVGPTIQ